MTNLFNLGKNGMIGGHHYQILILIVAEIFVTKIRYVTKKKSA